MSSDNSRGDGNDPWGKRHDDGPPDLFDLIKRFFGGGGKSRSNGGQSSDSKERPGRYVGYVIVGLAILWALTGIFLVSPAEQAVVLRFGKYVETVGPGPHWIPRVVDSKYTINVQQVSNFPYQAEMLTKDENIVSVAVAVQYRIGDPKKYLFNVVDPVTTLQQATSSALRQIVGQMTLNVILTTGRQQLRDATAKQLNSTLELYQAGLTVTDVTLQPAKPPEAVTHAFDDAIKAREDEQRYINQAQAYARRVESIAKGKVARLKQSAMAYQKEVALRAQGQTARYLALLKPYQEAPAVTRERLYLDTLSTVLSKTTNIVIDSGGNNVLYLPLDQILKRQLQQMKKGSTAKTDTTGTSLDLTSPTQTTPSSPDTGRPSYSVGDSS